MALAPLVYTLWNRVMRFDPADPIWPNRDRFVLSNGQPRCCCGRLLHLTKTQAVNADYERLGTAVGDPGRHPRLRQLDSKAPGHPEYHWVSGVETTTGPLGQGVATSVGMAIAEKWLAARYNRPVLRLSITTSMRLRRWLPDGRYCVESSIALRPFGPRQSLLGIRQQSHHDRRQHAPSPSRRT